MTSFRGALFVLLITTLAQAREVSIKWAPITGASKYEIQISPVRDAKKIEKHSSMTSRWKGDKAPGVYTYQVRGLDLFDKVGKWSEPHAFAVAPYAPKGLSPSEGTSLELLPSDAVTLRWDEAEGATKYIVEIQVTANPPSPTTSITSTEPQLKQTLAPGTYSWRVKSVIDVEGKHKGLTAKYVESDVSTAASFSIVTKPSRDVASLEETEGVSSSAASISGDQLSGQAFFSLSSLTGPYSYKVTSRSSANVGEVSSAFTSLRLGLDYRYTDELSAYFSFGDTFFKANSFSFDRKELELGGRYAWRPLGPGWRVLPSLSLTAREYFSLSRPTASDNDPPGLLEMVALGPTLGLEGQHDLADNFTVGVGVDYFFPLTMKGGPSTEIVSRRLNASARTYGVYRFSPELALRGDVEIANREIYFLSAGQSDTEETKLVTYGLSLGLLVALW